jgi:hypothetical protein
MRPGTVYTPPFCFATSYFPQLPQEHSSASQHLVSVWKSPARQENYAIDGKENRDNDWHSSRPDTF